MSEQFACPEVDESVREAVESYFERNGSCAPWDVVRDVSEAEGVSQESVRRVLRRLKLGECRLVPAEPFVGEVRLVNGD